MSTKILTARVPESLAEKVDQIAARMQCTRGWLVKEALSVWVSEEERRNPLPAVAETVTANKGSGRKS